MKKLLALLAILLLLPLTSLANDYIIDAQKDINASYPDDCRVTILDWGTDYVWISGRPRLFWSYSIADSTSVEGLSLLDEFQFGTHATGASEALSEDYSAAFPVSLTGDQERHLDGLRGAGVPLLNNTLTMTIPAGYMLTGPEEGSPYNSRLYFVRVYGQQGTLTATGKFWFSSTAETFTAAYTAPRIWVLYAVDVYVEPLGGTP